MVSSQVLVAQERERIAQARAAIESETAAIAQAHQNVEAAAARYRAAPTDANRAALRRARRDEEAAEEKVNVIEARIRRSQKIVHRQEEILRRSSGEYTAQEAGRLEFAGRRITAKERLRRLGRQPRETVTAASQGPVPLSRPPVPLTPEHARYAQAEENTRMARAREAVVRSLEDSAQRVYNAEVARIERERKALEQAQKDARPVSKAGHKIIETVSEQGIARQAGIKAFLNRVGITGKPEIVARGVLDFKERGKDLLGFAGGVGVVAAGELGADYVFASEKALQEEARLVARATGQTYREAAVARQFQAGVQEGFIIAGARLGVNPARARPLELPLPVGEPVVSPAGVILRRHRTQSITKGYYFEPEHKVFLPGEVPGVSQLFADRFKTVQGEFQTLFREPPGVPTVPLTESGKPFLGAIKKGAPQPADIAATDPVNFPRSSRPGTDKPPISDATIRITEEFKPRTDAIKAYEDPGQLGLPLPTEAAPPKGVDIIKFEPDPQINFKTNPALTPERPIVIKESFQYKLKDFSPPEATTPITDPALLLPAPQALPGVKPGGPFISLGFGIDTAAVGGLKPPGAAGGLKFGEFPARHQYAGTQPYFDALRKYQANLPRQLGAIKPAPQASTPVIAPSPTRSDVSVGTPTRPLPPSVELIQEQKPILEPIGKASQDLGALQSAKPKITQDSRLESAQRPRSAIRPVQDVVQRQQVAQTIVPALVTPGIPYKPLPPAFTPPRPPPNRPDPPPEIITPRPTGFKLPGGSGLVPGFNVLVRRRGVFDKVTTAPLSRREALHRGASIVGTTAAASFKIEPAGSPATGSFSGRGTLSDFIQKAGIFIEKRGRRIKSRGELEEITFKGAHSKKVRRSLLAASKKARRKLGVL